MAKTNSKNNLHNQHSKTWLVIIIALTALATLLGIGVRYAFIGPAVPSGQVHVVLSSNKEKEVSASDTVKLTMLVTNGTNEPIAYSGSSTCDLDSFSIDGQFAGPLLPCTADLQQFQFGPNAIKEFAYTITGDKIAPNCSNIQGEWNGHKSNIVVLCRS